MNNDFVLTKEEVIKSTQSFFVKNYNYKPYKSKLTDGLIYFYNPKNEYQILVIRLESTTVNQEEIDFIADKITKNSEKEIKVKVMHIILTDNKNDFSETKKQVEVYSTVQEIKNNLEPYFPNINLLNLYKKKPTSPAEVEITDEMKDSFDVSDEEKAKSLKNFLVSFKENKISFTWSILLLFILVPAIFTTIGMFVVPATYQDTINLVFGGTNYTITVLGQQWWRILTFGLAPTMSTSLLFTIFYVFIFGFAVFNTSKITELLLGNVWKMAIAFILSYLTLGFFASTVLPYQTTGGYATILGILVGILMMNATGNNTPVGKFSKFKAIWPIVLTILYTLFFGNKTDLLIIGIGLVIGSCYAGLIRYKYTDWNYTQWFMVIVVVAVIITGLVFVLKPHLIPAVSPAIKEALKTYADWNIFGGYDGVNNIVEKIGWEIYLNDAGNWVDLNSKAYSFSANSVALIANNDVWSHLKNIIKIRH